MGVRGQDGLTRQQRYDQRVATREAAAEVSVGHDGDVSDKGNVRMPETSESGEASEEEPAVQSIAKQEGMSDHVSDESEAREANLEAANQTLEGQMES
jgi:Ni,Fe-hydrogenase III large subunit